MKYIYIIYIVIALLNFWIILFLLGISAGFANYVPIMALGGSLLLFILASPLLVYKYRSGVFLGLAGCLLILPYDFFLIRGVFEDGIFNWGVLLAIIPSLFIFSGIYFTLRILLAKEHRATMQIHDKITKLLLAGLPIILFISYVLMYGKYWNMDFFKL